LSPCSEGLRLNPRCVEINRAELADCTTNRRTAII